MPQLGPQGPQLACAASFSFVTDCDVNLERALPKQQRFKYNTLETLYLVTAMFILLSGKLTF